MIIKVKKPSYIKAVIPARLCLLDCTVARSSLLDWQRAVPLVLRLIRAASLIQALDTEPLPPDLIRIKSLLWDSRLSVYALLFSFFF